jgi:ABC-type multidrug transport system ATPase subunit
MRDTTNVISWMKFWMFYILAVCFFGGAKKDEAPNQKCIGHRVCGEDGFCWQGACQSCWKCCAFGAFEWLWPGMPGQPGMRQVCQQRCHCRLGMECYGSAVDECGSGLLCNMTNIAMGIGTCVGPGGDIYDQMRDYAKLLGGNATFPFKSKERGCNQGRSCEAGYRCDLTVEVGEEDRWLRPEVVAMGGACVPCAKGEWCPKGGVVQPCPRGWYCPDPSVRVPCEAGTFCSEGMVAAQPCDYSRLMMQEVYVLRERDTVLDRLGGGDPWRGNYCPVNVTSPSRGCDPGWYCPNASVAVECPEGSFCKGGNVWPQQCPGLTGCPAGSAVPTVYGVPWMVLGLLCLAIGMVKVFQWWWVGRRVAGAGTASTAVCVEVVVDEGKKNEYEKWTFGKGVNHSLGWLEYKKVLSQGVLLEGGSESEFYGVLKAFVPFVRRAKSVVVRRMSAGGKDPWLWENSVAFPVGQMSAIMGASGCGKSVSLSLLRGKVPSGAKVTGTVHVWLMDGEAVDLDLEGMEKGRGGAEVTKLESFCGFVPQDDIVHGDLTVWENLWFGAQVKMPKLNVEQRRMLVMAVIKALELDRLLGSLVGSVDRRGISGGQRKRVNVGVEMVGLPPVLIMDEPTSGLDASMTLRFLEVCRDLARVGVTVLSVVHQPRYEAFMLFDHVLLLTKFGTVFCGSPAMGIAYFKHGLDEEIDVNENPADVLIDLVGKRQEELSGLWQERGWRWVETCRVEYPCLDIAMQQKVGWTEEVKKALENLLDDVCCSIGRLDEDYIMNERDVQTLIQRCGVPGVSVGSKLNVRRSTVMNEFRKVCEDAWLEGRFENVVNRVDELLRPRVPRNAMKTDAEHEAVETRHVRVLGLASRFGQKLMKRVGVSRERRHSSTSMLHDDADAMPLGIAKEDLLLCVMNIKACLHAAALETSVAPRDEEGDGLVGYVVLNARRTWGQMPVVMHRKLVQLWRSPWPIQILIPVVGAFIIGGIQGAGWGLKAFPGNVTMAMACLGVLSAVTHARTYGMDKTVVRRETDGPLNMTAYTVAYGVVDLIWLFLMPLVFGLPYYYFTLPQMGFGWFYAVGLMVCWWNSGMAYVVSALPLAMQWVNLIAVFISVIFGAFVNGLNPTVAEADGSVMQAVLWVSYNRWAMEILTLEEMRYYQDVVPNQVWGLMGKLGLCGETSVETGGVTDMLRLWRKFKSGDLVSGCRSYVGTAFGVMVAWGVFFRLLCYVIILLDSNVIVQRMLFRAKQK